jgi:hypothetical protein
LKVGRFWGSDGGLESESGLSETARNIDRGRVSEVENGTTRGGDPRGRPSRYVNGKLPGPGCRARVGLHIQTRVLFRTGPGGLAVVPVSGYGNLGARF